MSKENNPTHKLDSFYFKIYLPSHIFTLLTHELNLSCLSSLSLTFHPPELHSELILCFPVKLLMIGISLNYSLDKVAVKKKKVAKWEGKNGQA